jgi:hypothetical protein
MKNLKKCYRGFVSSDELPFVVGDQVPIKAGTPIYVCNKAGDVLGTFKLSTQWVVTITTIFNGQTPTKSDEDAGPTDHLDPRFGWGEGDEWLHVRFQDLLEQGAIPPCQGYA